MRLPKSLPPETVPFFTAYLDMPRIEPDELLTQVRQYLVAVRTAAETNPTVDVDLAQRIADGVEQLLAHAKSPDYPYVQAAAIYLIEDEDDQGDLTSCIGFDDDAEVFNAVCKFLDHPELSIDF